MKIVYPLAQTVLTSSNVLDSEFADWDIATAYTVGNIVYLPLSKGEYQALTANTGKQPDGSPTDWKFLGTTNKYKMFDQFLNTQTTNSSTIEIDMVAIGASTIYLGNLSATSVQISVVDNTTLSTIETYDTTLYRDVTDWLDYYFGDWIDNPDNLVTYERTTLTRDVSIIVTIDNGSNDAKCGIFFVGTTRNVGVTKYGVSIGALDYSTVATDTSSGATYLSRGNYAKTISLDLFINSSAVKTTYGFLTAARGLPIVVIGEGYDLLTVYGYIQKFEQLINGPVETAVTVDIIGLI